MTFLEYIQADALFYAINIVGFFVVVTITWLLTKNHQTKALVALKEQGEVVTALASNTFVEMQEQLDYEQDYLRRTAQLLEQALVQGNVLELRQQRQQLIDGLMLGYRPKVIQLTQLWVDYYKGDNKRCLERIKSVTIPFLETCRLVLGAVNAPAIIQLLPQDLPADQKFVLEERNLTNVFKPLERCGKSAWVKQYTKAMNLS